MWAARRQGMPDGLAWRGLHYGWMMGVPVGDGACILTDHMLLPLSWNRDAYYVARAMLEHDHGLADIVRRHLLWMFEVAERPDGLINDRFSGAHHDFVTTEYQAGQAPEGEAWENCRGIGSSFGFNQLECETQYLNGAQVVRHVVDAVSHGAACC